MLNSIQYRLSLCISVCEPVELSIEAIHVSGVWLKVLPQQQQSKSTPKTLQCAAVWAERLNWAVLCIRLYVYVRYTYKYMSN